MDPREEKRKRPTDDVSTTEARRTDVGEDAPLDAGDAARLNRKLEGKALGGAEGKGGRWSSERRS